MKQCPRCASEITSKMKKCERCGLPLDEVDFSDEIVEEEKKKVSKQEKKEAKKAKKLAKKQERKEKAERESVSNTDFSKYATNAEKAEEEPEEIIEKKGLFSKRSKKKKELEKPKFEIDENGEFNIDTKDVEIVGEETGKLIDEQYSKSYSVKKARGDYREPKIKWWEIYKLADRSFARRKIKKEVSKASKIKPEFISKRKLLLLSIFFGWCGAHNFYAKNKKKGWFQIITLFLWVFVTLGGNHIYWLSRIQISIGGFSGFLDCFIWFSDIFNIVFNTFKYRLQKEKFIFSMNVKTRAKLGEKYIDLDLYKKPWWVRFKVWCQKKKRNYEEWKHDRRQRLIEKEKAKQAKLEEKEKIEAELARHEERENAEFEKKKQERAGLVVDEKTLSELKSFGNEDSKTFKADLKTQEKDSEETETKEEKKVSKTKTAKAKFTSKTNKTSGSKKSSKNTTKKK